MRLVDYITRVAPKALLYEATRRGWMRPVNPLALTFSVTAACQALTMGAGSPSIDTSIRALGRSQ